MIKFNHVVKFDKNIAVINDLTFTINDNSVVAIIGGTQSGKTILTKLIAGLYKCDLGSIEIDKKSDDTNNKISLINESFEHNTNMNVYEYLKFYIKCYNLKINNTNDYIDDILQKYQLKIYKYADVDSLNNNIKKILYIVRSLMNNPDIIVMDSIMKDTNKETKEIIRNILIDNFMKKTIIVTCNNLVELGDICTHVIILNSGNLIAYDETDKILDMMDISRQIEIKILDSNKKLVEILKNDKMINNIVVDGDRILISYKGDDENCNIILKKIMDHNIRVYSFKKDIESFAYLNDSISKINNKILLNEVSFE